MKPLRNLRHIFAAPLAFPPGHFYSPICNPGDLQKYYRDPRNVHPGPMPGIDMNDSEQRNLWQSWRQHMASFPFPEHKGRSRYFSRNGQYDIGDAMVLYCMLRHVKPRRLIEVGSGFSSACTLDTIENYLGGDVRCTFVEPYPKLLYSLIGSEITAHTIIPRPVQDVPLETFDELESGDILFIDSTHILKTGSDVAFELFEILPRLKSGVIVHIHDMFYPFEYPREWVINRNYSWNEIYAVRAFLMNNEKWRILFFNDYFAKVARDLIERDAPLMLNNVGGALWLQRS